jgi:Raf kinase inhibitor-like YbhB/YbcL family protein
MTQLQLMSPTFKDHEPVPPRHAHDQENVSPAIRWSGVPEDATELVLVCEDPDAPNGTFLHWLVTGIDPATDGVAEGQTPPGGTEWVNGFGERGWGGPQPPRGHQHRYIIRLYALDQPVRMPDQPSADDVHRQLDQRALASGTVVGTYQR